MRQLNHQAHHFSAVSAAVRGQMCALPDARRLVYLITADLLTATLSFCKAPEPLKSGVAACLHPGDERRRTSRPPVSTEYGPGAPESLALLCQSL